MIKAMGKAAAVLVLTMMVCGSASAWETPGVKPHDLAGTWSGVVSGTFEGQPYAISSVIVITRDGQLGVETSQGPFGEETSNCPTSSFNAQGIGVAHCTQTAGFAAGLQYDVNFALTDRAERLPVWISVATPQLFLTGTYYRVE